MTVLYRLREVLRDLHGIGEVELGGSRDSSCTGLWWSRCGGHQSALKHLIGGGLVENSSSQFRGRIGSDEQTVWVGFSESVASQKRGSLLSRAAG